MVTWHIMTHGKWRFAAAMTASLLLACAGKVEEKGPSTERPPAIGGGTGGDGDGSVVSGGSGSGGGAGDGGSGGHVADFENCGCPDGSDEGVLLLLSEGGNLLFDRPPRFHSRETDEYFDCEAPETPILFDYGCVPFDLIEACHEERGCLQIKKTTFVWLDSDGQVIAEGASNYDYIKAWGVGENDTKLFEFSAVLQEEGNTIGTISSSKVCSVGLDICLK